MADANVSRLGQINATGDELALFYKKAMPEIMATFHESNVMMPLHTVRTISKGKSASFPAIGQASASYHVPGNELTGLNNIKKNERIISIDGLLVADVFIANIDEAMSEYEYRSQYMEELGVALADKADIQLLRVAALTARASATVDGGSDGTSVTDANAATVAANLAADIYAVAQAFDEKKLPARLKRYCAVKPAQYYMLAQAVQLINKDWGGMGSYADGKIVKIADIELVKTNNVPSTDVVSAETGTNNTYHGDFSTTAAVVWCPPAFGTVKLLDLAMESEYLIQLQGWLMVAKYAMGHGILRPECAAEIKTA